MPRSSAIAAFFVSVNRSMKEGLFCPDVTDPAVREFHAHSFRSKALLHVQLILAEKLRGRRQENEIVQTDHGQRDVLVITILPFVQ